MNHSKIEYAVNEDDSRGYSWNWLTGCANGPYICLTRETCWAKIMALRFKGSQFTDKRAAFLPTFHQDIFDLTFPRKSGARILVCFTGDISYASPVDINRAFARILCHPEHTFILLTKRPKEAYRDIDWQANTWLGVSLTGAETLTRQQQVIDELRAVKGQHKRWVSFEPMLDRLQVSLEGIDWLVIGCQTGKGGVKPDVSWAHSAMDSYCGASNYRPMWIKNNLSQLGWWSGWYRQDLPND